MMEEPMDTMDPPFEVAPSGAGPDDHHDGVVVDVGDVPEPAAPGAPPSREEPPWEPPGDNPFWRWAWHRLTVMTGPGLVRLFIDVAAVGLACLFVFVQLRPDLILAVNTPTGGDMGAHVLAPAYLRDHLLPSLRLTGWSPDWYAGLPLFQFYMVVPALAIVALNVGLRGWLALLPLAAAVALVIWAGRVASQRRRRWLVAAAVAVAVLGIGVPYGVAFKLVTVLGPVALPLACYFFGRMAGVPFPGPALMAGGSLLFMANTEPNVDGSNTGNIIGGNLTSTMAGEYSFTISLTFMVLYFGVLLRGMRTGRHRAAAAVLLALCGLCHLIPLIYAVVGTAVAFVVAPPSGRRLGWLVTTLPVAGLLTAFWTLPFVWQRAYLNDMGWERLPLEGSDLTARDFLLPSSFNWLVALAAVGLVMSIAFRRRAGPFLAGLAVLAAIGFVTVPELRLWNARILPLWYLAIVLLAAVGVAELGRAFAVLVARDPGRPVFTIEAVTGAVGVFCALAIAGVHVGSFPGGHDTADGGYRWGPFEVSAEDRSSARGWAAWNFSGYEAKEGYPEYYALVQTMRQVGEDHGCGRALWEYGGRLGQYGTPMAPMLLPYWTDGCIGSMEGLFFESSATTPYHFLTQSALSFSGSRAQRDLPYTGFDLDLGVRQLQLMGVRYYLAYEEYPKSVADEHPDLEQIATSGPWTVYEVAGAELVTPLENEPAVLDDIETPKDWIQANAEWYQDPSRWDVFYAADGPPEWQRIGSGQQPEVRPVGETVAISNVDPGRTSMSFDVSDVGTPVLVRMSYFPNWTVEGADGPYRVSPNLMVVIPTDTHVELRYGRAPVDLVSILLTLLGIVGVVWLARQPAIDMTPRRRAKAVGAADLEPEPGPEAEPEAEAESEADVDAEPEPVWDGLEPADAHAETADTEGRVPQ
jgi:hypothetical protein